jgi:hypothetical protein
MPSFSFLVCFPPSCFLSLSFALPSSFSTFHLPPAFLSFTLSSLLPSSAIAFVYALQVEGLAADTGMSALVDSGELLVVGAFYEMSSGIVDLLEPVAANRKSSVFKRTPTSSDFIKDHGPPETNNDDADIENMYFSGES